jgi:hypothetical protein
MRQYRNPAVAASCQVLPPQVVRFAQQLAAALQNHQDLRLTRLAGGELGRSRPAKLRENG